MSLHHLLPDAGVSNLMEAWPDEPRVYDREPGPVAGLVDAEFLYRYVETGCVPAAEVAVVKAPMPSLNAAAFTTNGRTDAAKLRRLHEQGHTIRMGNIQRVMPELAEVSRGIQYETGYSNYVHAFLTPPGNQGLRHHWDQQMAVIVQLAGVKRWELWPPPVEAPMREHNESWRVWKDEYLRTWEAQGPTATIDLGPGQSLVLPRGWVHNPYVVEGGGASVHLTFAIRERTPLWLMEKLTAAVIENSEVRRIIEPGALLGPELVARLRSARKLLIEHLTRVDIDELAPRVREAAGVELEYTT